MPQLIALALIGAGAMAGYRWVAKQVDAARQAADDAEAKLRQAAEQRQSEGPRDLGQLEWDEVSQVYKPRR
jgi:predicted negative regulator of RcsB-dependent stress response